MLFDVYACRSFCIRHESRPATPPGVKSMESDGCRFAGRHVTEVLFGAGKVMHAFPNIQRSDLHVMPEIDILQYLIVKANMMIYTLCPVMLDKVCDRGFRGAERRILRAYLPHPTSCAEPVWHNCVGAFNCLHFLRRRRVEQHKEGQPAFDESLVTMLHLPPIRSFIHQDMEEYLETTHSATPGHDNTARLTGHTDIIIVGVHLG